MHNQRAMDLLHRIAAGQDWETFLADVFGALHSLVCLKDAADMLTGKLSAFRTAEAGFGIHHVDQTVQTTSGPLYVCFLRSSGGSVAGSTFVWTPVALSCQPPGRPSGSSVT